MAKYRKKPVVIEAVQFTGENCRSIVDFCKGSKDWVRADKEKVIIQTLEGDMTANIGDYIIKGVNGEFYPCKPDVFEKTYELVES
ncbi:MAG: hypothetical protein ABF633_02890 [Clostridium sp.]|uniref:hypothetical protein n=1 Tax=Clostridium sp. TaxID=1506 RepID=UPI0039EC3D40